MRIALRLFSGVLTVLVVYVGYIIILVLHDSTLDEAKKSDAIVVLGAAQYNGRPSPVLQARLDHAIDLWKAGIAPKIVVTGGRVPGDETTEAGASAAYLGAHGVPDAAVLREVQGRSSWESLAAAARFCKARNIHTVVLVSDPFHNARIAAMTSDLGLEPRVSPTTTSPISREKSGPYYVREILALGVGKIVGFDRVAALERASAV